MADEAAALFEAAVVVVGGLEGLLDPLDQFGHRVGEGGGDVVVGGGPVPVESEEIISALGYDRFGDGGLGSDGVDRHEGALELQPLEQERDGRDLVDLASTAS